MSLIQNRPSGVMTLGRLVILEKKKSIAELLAQALAYHRRAVTRAQEAYILSIHGTKFRMVAVHFRYEYLKHVQSRLLSNHQEVYVRRSKWFELKEPDGEWTRYLDVWAFSITY